MFTYHTASGETSGFVVILHDQMHPREKHGGNARAHPKQEIRGKVQTERNVPYQEGWVTEKENSSCKTERYPDWIDPVDC
jgi:hypothetical protein